MLDAKAVKPVPGQNPALHNLDGNLDFGFVARPPHACWQDRRAVMGGDVLISAAEPRLVATGRRDGGLEVVADDLPRDTARTGKRADVQPIQSGSDCVQRASA